MPTHLFLERAKAVLERRLFLKALGLGLAAPVALRLSRSATAAATGAAKRFFVMYVPHGIAPEHFNPKMGSSGAPTDFALDMTNESILGPLEPYKQLVNVYQGFQFLGDSASHEGIIGILSGGSATDGSSPRTTLEHVIGKGLGVQPLILGACSHDHGNFTNHSQLFWDGSKAVDPQLNPFAAFDKLFGANTGPTVSADDQLKSALLDLTTAELQDLKTTAAGLTKEQTKLDSHLDAIATLKTGAGSGQSTCTQMITLPTVEAVRKASVGQTTAPSGQLNYFEQEANFRTIFQAQLEVVAQALICNAAQVIGLMPLYATSDIDFSFIGGTAPNGWTHHTGLSHIAYQQASGAQWNSPLSVDNADPMTRAIFGKAQRWFYEQLVTNVVAPLASAKDPEGGTVLDNTIILLVSEVGDSANHTTASKIESPQIPAYLPLVTIGGGGGSLVTQQVITLPIVDNNPEQSTRPATDLYLTLAKAMGVATPTFPGTTGVVDRVLA
jgi:hypothetical protein